MTIYKKVGSTFHAASPSIWLSLESELMTLLSRNLFWAVSVLPGTHAIQLEEIFSSFFIFCKVWKQPSILSQRNWLFPA